jgi:1,4-dihydroxy-2-naphthoyl-CoA hydrolase
MADAGFAAAVPFAGLLGIEIVAAEPDEVRGNLPWRADLCTSGGILHGGALMAFADTLGGVCAFLHLPEGAGTATVESKTNFFRPLRDGVVTGVARPLHVGRSFIVVQTDLTDDSERRIAQVTQTQAVITRRPE